MEQRRGRKEGRQASRGAHLAHQEGLAEQLVQPVCGQLPGPRSLHEAQLTEGAPLGDGCRGQGAQAGGRARGAAAIVARGGERGGGGGGGVAAGVGLDVRDGGLRGRRCEEVWGIGLRVRIYRWCGAAVVVVLARGWGREHGAGAGGGDVRQDILPRGESRSEGRGRRRVLQP